MKKEIKRIGNSVGIIFNKEERKIYELIVGGIIDIDFKVIQKEKRK